LLVRKFAEQEGINLSTLYSWQKQLSDNGALMRSLTMRAKMYDLGVITSRSRPRVSNNNLYSESLFRTVKCRLGWPSKGFKLLDEARKWVKEFVYWYNNEHRHNRIKFVTPN
jgi:transposase InsO family protein